MRATVTLLFLAALGIAAAHSRAETLISDAKIVSVDARRIVIKLASGPLAVHFDARTRFWKAKARGDVGAFAAGDDVFVRIKADADPPMLREMADVATWTWLDAIRKHPQKVVVGGLDARYLTVKLPDGSTFAYRATAKSQVSLQGKPNATLADLAPGTTVYIKARTLPTLDTWVVLASDRPILDKAGSATGPKGVKLPPLSPSGTLEGTVTGQVVEIKMIDLAIADRTLHLTYTATTKFTLDGKAADVKAVRSGLRAKATYKRDKQGRILASAVDLTSP